jgi:hypothetical protein
MDAEPRPKVLSELKIGKIIGSDERQKLLGVVVVNVQEIAYMIEQNEDDLQILTAILSLDKVLDRLELSLIEDRSDRPRSINRSAGKGGKGGTGLKK